MAGIVLGAPQHAVLLGAADPHGRLLAHPHRVGAEGARLDDRVLGLEIEIAHGGERPIDPDRARFGRGDHPTGAGGVQVVQPAECRGRRQLGEPSHLLRRAALQVRADQQGAPRLLPQLPRERRDGLAGPPEDDKTAYPGGERGVDLGALVRETLAPPAQRGKDETSERPGHAGVMWPSTRGPRAPVAAGRFPGSPRTVRNPSNANTRASLASPSKNRRSNGTTGRGATRAVRSSTSRGLRAPPPEITSSSEARAGVQRSIPRAMVSTVSAVAVAPARLLYVVDQPRRVVGAETLAARALGWRRGEIGICEQRVEHLAGRLAAPRSLAAGVESRGGVDPTGHRVDHANAGTRVERDGAARDPAARREGD